MKNQEVKFPLEREKLLEMYELDQNIRANGDFNKAETDLEMTAIDLENQKKLIPILKKIKTPTVKNIGIDGCETVWIIAQHAAYDLKLMKKVLILMQSAMKDNSKNGYFKGVPYLIDRINIMEGKNQLYGTQFWGGPSGTPTPYPIDDISNIEKRRASFGIRPYSEYKKNIIEINKSQKKHKIYHIIY